MMAEVEVANLGKRFGGAWAVREVSFTVAAGSFVSLLGPSGCGKTTTLRLVAGFLDPDEGGIRIGGAPVEALPPWRRNLGVVFQNYALFPFLSVFDNIAFGLRRRRMAAERIRDRVLASMDLVGLPGLEGRYPRQLSGGQQQRVALARALVIRPRLLLLDEPLSNLDARLRAEMRFELKRIQRETGVTTIFVTHDQEEALTLSDRIVVMRHGRVERTGTPREVWERPKTPFVADFLGVENLLPGRAEGGGVRLGDSGPWLPAAAGEGDLVVGIRALDMRVEPDAGGESPDANGAATVAGRLRERNYTGHGFVYQIETAVSEKPLVAASRDEMELGARVRLRIDGRRIMLLR